MLKCDLGQSMETKFAGVIALCLTKDVELRQDLHLSVLFIYFYSVINFLNVNSVTIHRTNPPG